VLLAKKETSLQGMPDSLTEIGRCNGMDMNVDKTKVKMETVHSTDYDRSKRTGDTPTP
jgi:hypothetical protein